MSPSEFRQLGLKPGGPERQLVRRRAVPPGDAVPRRRQISLTSTAARRGLLGKDAAGSAERDRAATRSMPRRWCSSATACAMLGSASTNMPGSTFAGRSSSRLPSPAPGMPSEVAAHLDSPRRRSPAPRARSASSRSTTRRRPRRRLQRFATRPVVDWVDAQGRTGRAGAAARPDALSPDGQHGCSRARRCRCRCDPARPRAGRSRGFASARAADDLSATSDWQDFTSPEVVGGAARVAIRGWRASMSC